MMSDYKPVTINAATQSNNSIADMKNKVHSDDRVLNTILQFSKTKPLELNTLFIDTLKQALLLHYGVPSITHDHLLKIVFDKYNKILLDKRFEVYQSIDSIVLDLLKFTPIDNTGVGVEHTNGTTIYGTFITHEILIKRLLIEITLSRVDWLDYNQI
jgi:hypothetical protein